MSKKDGRTLWFKFATIDRFYKVRDVRDKSWDTAANRLLDYWIEGHSKKKKE